MAMKTLILLLSPIISLAQLKLKPIEPKEIKEGQKFEFRIFLNEKSDSLKINWDLSGNTAPSMSISSKGVFSWMPDFKVVAQNETLKTFDFYVKATSHQDSMLFADSVLVNLTVENTNTPPIIPQKQKLSGFRKLIPKFRRYFQKNIILMKKATYWRLD
jgi:hypothetical protein